MSITILIASCQDKDSSGIVDNLLLNLIHYQKQDISRDWDYEESGEELTALLSIFEDDIHRGNDLENTLNELNTMFNELNINIKEVGIGSVIDSLHQAVNGQKVSLDNKKYACFQLFQYMSWRKKNIVFNHNWKIRLFNLDTVYIPNKRKMSYLYMLFNPLGDTIRATDMNYGSAPGDLKSINIFVDGKAGDVVKRVVELPMTNPVSDEVRIYRDTVLIKIIND